MEPPPIYTIGYGRRSMPDFLALLAQYGIAYLIDVRSRPYSKFKPEFSRDALAAAVTAAGLRYVYMGDTLGGQPADRSLYGEDGRVAYDKVSTQPSYLHSIRRLRRAWEQDLTVVVLCSEEKPTRCHRTRLIARSLVANGIEVRHIDENGALMTHDEVMLAMSGGQLYLLPPAAASRKKYPPTIKESDDGV